MMKKRSALWLVSVALLSAILLLQSRVFSAAADAPPYSVSLNSAVTFPVDI